MVLNKYEVIGISRSVNEDGVFADYAVLKGCRIIFVCTPMNVTLEILDKLNSYVDSDTIVTDVCSLKCFVSKRKYNYKFIPSHPMAGTEHSGWEHSFGELFQNAKWVITPIDLTLNNEQKILESVIKDLGADIIITTPDEHDKAVALISHFPLVVAQALCESIKDNKLAQTLAASGFRDATRLALSNSEMANDMVNMNKLNIKFASESFKNSLETLINNANYKEQAINIKNFRDSLYD